MTDLLFDLEPEPGEDQECDRCEARAVATIDQLRAAGWIAFDGVSLTDKTLTVRMCPACRAKRGPR